MTRTVMAAWVIAATYYFYQYVTRSAPAVMMPQLAGGLGVSAVAAASIVGLFYYGYSGCSLVAGPAIDAFGPRAIVPVSAAVAGAGALLFGTGYAPAASVGRFLQGAGGAFAFVGAAYLVMTSFPPSRAATLVGATQMFGMAGGSAGQFLVAPMIEAGIPWTTLWVGIGLVGIGLSTLLFVLLPKSRTRVSGGWGLRALSGLWTVIRNPQSILCGAIAGLLFMPTTIFDMVWGVRFLQEAHGFDYAAAVVRSSTVPLGWIVGAPLVGFLSDRVGRRKPIIVGGAAVLLACLAWILHGPSDVFPPYVVGLVTGIASGAAMLPYTVIKEANPPALSGTATGVLSFLNFTITALLGPVFGSRLTRGRGGAPPTAETYGTAFEPLLYGVALSIVLAFLMRETGPEATDTTLPLARAS